MHIRPAISEDAPAISELILSVAHFFTLDPAGRGAEDFLQSLQPAAVAARLATAAFTTSVAVEAETGDLAGVIVVRDGIHLFHLFVAEPYQRRGWARLLWLHALSQAPQGTRMTVNATPFAQGFYERMGFITTGPAVQTRGIAFVPMAREGEGERHSPPNGLASH